MDLSERLEAEVAKSSALQRENERLKDDMVKLAGSLAGKLEALDVEQGTESTVSPSEQDDLDAAAPALAPRNSRAGSIKDIAEEENEMVALATGDLIWLKQDDPVFRGAVLGDMRLRTAGVQASTADSGEFVAPLRFNDGVFRLCSRLNYRSKAEVNRVMKAVHSAENPEQAKKDLGLEVAQKRMASEAAQNADLLDCIVHSEPEDLPGAIRYGDVVQLQHVNSGLFLAVHKTPAAQNPNCRKVSLKAGSLAVHFKILPKFKVRSVGSPVYADEKIVLQSVKHDGLCIGASNPLVPPAKKAMQSSSDDNSSNHPHTAGFARTVKLAQRHSILGAEKLRSFGPCEDNDHLNLRLPAVLRNEAAGEVNASLDVRSFIIKKYGRIRQERNLSTSFCNFRLFHPESNGFIQASSNPDKGQVLDALGTAEDPMEATRDYGVPAHVPYLKLFSSTTDASSPANFSAKAVWCFEPLDRTTCVEVKWRTMPLRIRHVPSGKYLSVDSTKRASVRDSRMTKPESALLFDVALVSDADPSKKEGTFGSPSSLIFHLMPTDLLGASDSLRAGTSSLRIEHRTKSEYGTLYLKSTQECKPPMLESVGGSVGWDEDDSAVRQTENLRLCFCSGFSALDVLKLMPLYEKDDRRLKSLLSYLPLFKKYAFKYHIAADKSEKSLKFGPPVGLCEQMASQCMDLMDDLRKGAKVPRRNGGNLAEALKEVASKTPEEFAVLCTGEPNFDAQKMACEIKLLDAVFEAALAPYNYAEVTSEDGRPFEKISGSGAPRALQKFLHVTLQRMVTSNLVSQNYFAHRRSRMWVRRAHAPSFVQEDCHSPLAVLPSKRRSLRELTFGALQSVSSLGSSTDTAESKDFNDLLPIKAMSLKSMSRCFTFSSAEEEDNDDEFEFNGVYSIGDAVISKPVSRVKNQPQKTKYHIERKWDLWRNIIVEQVSDSMGAAVTLRQLLMSNEKIVSKLVNEELMDRFKTLVVNLGPEHRVISLFTSICYLEGRPSKPNQEMCLRKLWMDPKDRYSFCVTFHEINFPPDKMPKYGRLYLPSGELASAERKRTTAKYPPKAYLGKTECNRYLSICVAWKGAADWDLDQASSLFWSPGAIGIPVAGSLDAKGEGTVELVCLEQLMWVLHPERLCKPVTGRAWIAVEQSGDDKKKRKAQMHQYSSSMDLSRSSATRILRREKFYRHHQLATYVIAQLNLLTNMCKGRNYEVISWLEKSFSYDMLMNMATNPWLPFQATAAAFDLVQALFVDRFPQPPDCGAWSIPEKLFMNEDSTKPGTSRIGTKASAPIRMSMGSSGVHVHQIDVKHADAFPAFALSPLCSAFGHPDPVLSHPDHFKFFLLRSLCNDTIKSFGQAGRVIHKEDNLNTLAVRAIQGQQVLMKFGFQSTYQKLKDLCLSNDLQVLDGRSDLETIGKVFDPPRARFLHTGATSAVVTRMKWQTIQTFLDLTDLRTNYRLTILLNLFKAKFQSWTKAEKQVKEQKMVSSCAAAKVRNEIVEECQEAQYLLQSTPAAVDALYADFEDMFPGGSSDAAKLDFAVLAEKPDIDQALIDCMMYDDDNLMSAALRLLESTYGQRRHLRLAMEQVIMLEDEKLPVFGDVHHLRAELAELVYLCRRTTFWGVKSPISGPFGDKDFALIMNIIDRLLMFLHSASESKKRYGYALDEANLTDSFQETGLDGVHYECNNLWSLDVAAKWSDKAFLAECGPINAQNQNILRACNVSPILKESVNLDEQHACKGSVCTQRERAESIRRLALVKRALLILCTAFTQDCRLNQELMFSCISELEELVTPRALRQSLTIPGPMLNEVPASQPIQAQKRGRPWPSTITEHAQNLILTILRGHEALCDQVSPTLMRNFIHIVNLEEDVSHSPALDLVFILMKPEAVSVLDVQNLTVVELLRGNSGTSRAIRGGLASAVGRKLSIAVEGSSSSSSEGGGGKSSTSLPALHMSDPARMIRLISGLIDGSNESTASYLRDAANLTIDIASSVIVTHLEDHCPEAPLRDLSKLKRVETSSALKGDTSAMLHATSVCKLLAEKDTVGHGLHALLVEQFFLLPLNAEQVSSPTLWLYLEKGAVPLMEYFGTTLKFSADEQALCVDLIDMLEKIFISLVRFGLFETTQDSAVKGPIVTDLVDNVAAMLKKRQKTPEFLREAFLEECEAHDTASLDKEQYIALLAKFVTKPLEGREVAELEEDFEEADVDGSGKVDLFEFTALYGRFGARHESFVASENASSLNVLNEHGHRFSNRTVACCERLMFMRAGGGHELGTLQFSRSEHHKARRRRDGGASGSGGGGSGGGSGGGDGSSGAGKSSGGGGGGRAKQSKVMAQTNQGKVMAQASNHSLLAGAQMNLEMRSRMMNGGGSDGSRSSRSSRSSGGSNASSSKVVVVPFANKFSCFQAGLHNNPRILGALQRRRFTMVSILEKGTPGPPPGDGRRLHKAPKESTYSLYAKIHVGNVGHAKTFSSSSNSSSKGRSGPQKQQSSHFGSGSKSNKAAAAANNNKKVHPSAPMEMSRHKSARYKRESKSTLFATEEERAAFCIQSAFRSFKAFQRRKELLEFAVGHGGRNNNLMSGAVELTWEDVTERFVRYVNEHFTEPVNGEHANTCELIFETWIAHLMKARTWALDAEGNKTEISKSVSLKLCIPYDLEPSELAVLVKKQNALNRMGVTKLLARVVSSLDSEGEAGGLPDVAVEVFTEILNGGNSEVQQSLYDHLVHTDTEGKVVRYLERRLMGAFGGLVEAKNAGRIGSNDDTRAQKLSADCDGVVLMARFLQLLCEGHFVPFQNYLRAQPMHNNQVNLVQNLLDVLIFICDSTVTISRFTYVELDLVTQLLNTLIEVVQGPCAGNQELIAQSDLIISLNLIVNAVNARDDDLSKLDPGHMGIKGLSCILLSACLEGRQDMVVQNALLRRLEAQALASYCELLEEKVRRTLRARRSSYRLISDDDHERLKVLLFSMVATITVGNVLSSHRKSLTNSSSSSSSSSNNSMSTSSSSSSSTATASAADRQQKQYQASNSEGDTNGSGGGGSGSGSSSGSDGAGKDSSSSLLSARQKKKRRRDFKRVEAPLVGFVEIAWRGKVERTCFPLPFEIQHLPEETKKAFLDEVDLSTSEKRMKALVKKTDFFVVEMRLIYRKAEQSRLYRFCRQNIFTIQQGTYALVMLLNMNILLAPISLTKSSSAAYADDDDDDSGGGGRRELLAKIKAKGGSGDDTATVGGGLEVNKGLLMAPFSILVGDLDGSHSLDTSERMSLGVTSLLCFLVLLGYGIIVTTYAVTEVPMVIRQLDEEDGGGGGSSGGGGDDDGGDDGASSKGDLDEDKEDGDDSDLSGGGGSSGGGSGGGNGSSTAAWLPLVKSTVASSVCIGLHALNFDANFALYAFLCAVNIPLAFAAARAHLANTVTNNQQQNTTWQRFYVIAYDCLVARSFLRNPAVLSACCLLGFFVTTSFFSLALLDVVFISPVIADIIQSITSPIVALGLVFYLFLVTVLIYASFGMSWFNESMRVKTFDYETGLEELNTCQTLLSCFYFIFYESMSDAGNLKGILSTPEVGTNNYWTRIAFDSVFFVWVGIILLNIITGLMVDTFSSIREDKQAREENLENDCFVCGTLRNTYEDLALPPSAPGFDTHLAEDHNIWNYVYYIAYLKEKDPTEDSGIESYVRSQVAEFSLEWIPSRTSYVLEANGMTGFGRGGAASNEGGGSGSSSSQGD